MQARHKQLLESYERVREFLRTHTPAQPSEALVAKAEEMEAFVSRLRALLSDQVSGRNESKDDMLRTELARRNLRDRHLKPIAKIAKAMLALEPTALKSLALPSLRLTNTKLLMAAASVREAAQKYEQVFVENGRPADFLAKLDAAIARLRDAQLGRAASVGLQVGARVGVEAQLKRGRKLVEVLDTLVTDAFEGNEVALARWRLAKRVKGLPGSPRPVSDAPDGNLPTAA